MKHQPLPPGWRTMDTAPQSTVEDGAAKTIYILGYCPEEGGNDPQSRISVIWWEPFMNHGRGLWWGERDWPVYPTKWQPLPLAPAEDTKGPNRDERRRLAKSA